MYPKFAVVDCLSKTAKVDCKKPHAPLLFIAGNADYIMPASLSHTNFKKYKDAGSVTDYQEFNGKNHFVLRLPNWKEEAEFTLNWISKN